MCFVYLFSLFCVVMVCLFIVILYYVASIRALLQKSPVLSQFSLNKQWWRGSWCMSERHWLPCLVAAAYWLLCAAGVTSCRCSCLPCLQPCRWAPLHAGKRKRERRSAREIWSLRCGDVHVCVCVCVCVCGVWRWCSGGLNWIRHLLLN